MTEPVNFSQPLLTAKLRLPRPHTTVIARERLTSYLEAGVERKLTLISAPAGSGKTTLVGQWLATSAYTKHFGWLSLTEADNDPIRFWQYVAAACQQASRLDFSEVMSVFLRAEFRGVPSAGKTFLDLPFTLFLNELQHLTHKTILVLEDYHFITSPLIQEMLKSLLEYLPANLHLCLLTRNDPPLPLASLRAHGYLNELYASDLRFSTQEITTFFRRALPIALTSENIEHIEDRTEGWATGLRLILLTLQQPHSQAEIIARLEHLTGNRQHILSFFISEVFESQPEPIQIFLLQTSILERLHVSLCNAVTERQDSQQILKNIEQANLFLQALDDPPVWYRYHHLFSEALQHYAHQYLGEVKMQLYAERASIWYEAEGMLPEAIDTAMRASNFIHAAELLDRFIGRRHLFDIHEHETLRVWFYRLPDEILYAHPNLCLRFAMLLQFARAQDHSFYQRIDLLLGQAEKYWRETGQDSKLGEAFASQALISIFRGHKSLAARLANQALVLLPEEEQQWCGTARSVLARVAFQEGQYAVARRILVDLQQLNREIRNFFALRQNLIMLGQICLYQGELYQSTQYHLEILSLAKDDDNDRVEAMLGRAEVTYTCNMLDDSEHDARQAFALAERNKNEELSLKSLLLLARIQFARGETTIALKQFADLYLGTHANPVLQREIAAWQASACLHSGDKRVAYHWASWIKTQTRAARFCDREMEECLLLRIQIHQGEAEAALQRLITLKEDAHLNQRTASEWQLTLLIALALQALGEQETARNHLLTVLPQTQKEGVQRLFLDLGSDMASILRELLQDLEHLSLRNYVRGLLQAYSQQPDQPLSRLANTALREPLSPQEQSILRLLVNDASNADIATILVISANTVKTHIRNLYRKLSVKTRKEAKEAATSLSLL